MRWIKTVSLSPLVMLCVVASGYAAQDQQGLIPNDAIVALRAELAEATQATSSARQKLALRRVIRSTQGLLEKNAAAANRFEVLGVQFSAQQQLLGLDGSATNRQAFLETCRELVKAPNEYAAIRLDADLLLSQADLARQGADQEARADALKPLVDRYAGTEVEAKVIRIAMLMAIEFGDASLIQHLREVIARRMPGNLEMINFQRDHLAGQVFGAPFVGRFEAADGEASLFPMDAMGKTTALYFWSKQDDGIEQLKAIAQGWDAVSAEPDRNAEVRYQFISFNLDDLPDAGESILREVGLDWPAMRLPGGTDNPIYKTYVRNTPKLLTMTPSGYTAMIMSGSTRVKDGGWERALGSGLSRTWSSEGYAVQTQSILIGEFAVIDPQGDFDPAAPPEWKAVHDLSNASDQQLKRTAASVPEETLRAIQACFIAPPQRYALSYEQLIANYKKADELCRQAIADHPDAQDLWIVRNRRIVALMGLWKVKGQREYFDAAAAEAATAIEKGYPAGTDVIARFCLARQDLRAKDADRPGIIKAFAGDEGQTPRAVTTDALASLLALDIADRALHEHYRRASLDQYANHPALWTATAFYLDRYHRYWLYHPPFTAGWTYGRRMSYFFAVGEQEDAARTIQANFQTLDGEPFRIPEDLNGKYTIIEFLTDGQETRHLRRYGQFISDRPFDDVNIVYAYLDADKDAIRQDIQAYNEQQTKRRQPIDNGIHLVLPGGLNHPIVRQLGVIFGDGDRNKTNLAFLGPDGTVAGFNSGMASSKGNVAENMLQAHDERLVEQALARGDLEEAKRLAFAHAPLEQVAPEDAPKNWKPKKISVPHLRARAKVYVAMKQWDAALADAQAVYLSETKQAGHISLRTERLDEIERLRDHIQKALEQSTTTN